MTNLAEKIHNDIFRTPEGLLKPDLNGLFLGIPEAEYRAYDAMSASGLPHLNKSPAHYQVYLNEPSKSTPAKDLGKQFHAAFLEPELFKNYVIMPDIDRRTKIGKDAYVNFMAENHEKTIVTQENYDTIQGMLEACYRHPQASVLLGKGKNEVSGFWRDPITGVRCKLRADKILDNDLVVDVKTTDDASEGSFKRSIGKYMYHLQACFYLEGVGLSRGKVLSNFLHLAVETSAPYGINCFSFDDVSLAAASDKIRELLELYENCKKAGSWPCYEPGVKTISIPAFLLNTGGT